MAPEIWNFTSQLYIERNALANHPLEGERVPIVAARATKPMAMDTHNTCLRMPQCRGVDIEECSISQLQDYLSKSAFTSRDLTGCYLRRIELVNPRVKAVIETNPDALDIASKLDEERQNGHVRSRLHGIPFLLKDNIASKDKMETTAGSAALVGAIVPADARVVRLLRDAGAVLLGKANLSEWASIRASYYAEGYSSRGKCSSSTHPLFRIGLGGGSCVLHRIHKT